MSAFPSCLCPASTAQSHGSTLGMNEDLQKVSIYTGICVPMPLPVLICPERNIFGLVVCLISLCVSMHGLCVKLCLLAVSQIVHPLKLYGCD